MIGKQRLAILKNPAMIQILKELDKQVNNSVGLVKIIKKDQSTIYRSLIYLSENNYILKSDLKRGAYKLNKVKIKLEIKKEIDKIKQEANNKIKYYEELL